MGTGLSKNIRLLGVSAVFAFFAGLAIVGLLTVLKGEPENYTRTSKPAQGFTLKTQEGREVSLESHKGRVVMLHFWASWCAPCLEEIPMIVKYARSLEDQPFTLIAITLDENWPAAQAVLKDHDLPENFVSVLDEGAKVADLYGSFNYPETYLLTPELQVAYKWVGPQNWSMGFFRDAVVRLAPKP